MITITNEQFKKVLIAKYLRIPDCYFYDSDSLDETHLIVEPEKFAEFILSHSKFIRFLSDELKRFERTGLFKPFSWENDLTKFLSKIAKDYPDYNLIKKTIKARIDKENKEMKDKINFFWDIQKLEKAGYKVIPPPQKNKKTK